MKERRATQKEKSLCSGPAKLVQAFEIAPLEAGTSGINKCLQEDALQKGNLLDIAKRALSSTYVYMPQNISAASIEGESIWAGRRVGISHAQDLFWRFGVKSAFLSKPFEEDAKAVGKL